LQKFFGIVEQLVRLLGVHSERSRGKLRGNGRLRYGGVRRHEANFVHVNVRIAFKRRLQLLRQLGGLAIGARRESAHEARQARLGNLGGEMDAGNAGRRKHARETLLRRGRIKRGAIQQQAIARGSQQQAGLVVWTDGGAQFAPCSFVLLRRARMTEVIHSSKLQQNVQATDEGAGSSGSSGIVSV